MDQQKIEVLSKEMCIYIMCMILDFENVNKMVITLSKGKAKLHISVVNLCCFFIIMPSWYLVSIHI